jgi:hypothetical protein
MTRTTAVHVAGVGQSTGQEYINNEHFIFNETEPGPNGAWGFTMELHGRFISKGSAPNSWSTFQLFFVVNANGDVTVDRFVSTFGCVGARA